MKLMPVKQAKDATDAQTQRDIIRAGEAKTELKSAISELEKAEASFKLALANQSIRQINEETEHGKAISALTDEIKKLELRRAELLIPIEEEQKEAHNMFIKAEELRRKNLDTEIELDNKSELLENKLDDASEQLEAITRRTAELGRRENGIKQQEEMTKQVVEELTAKVNEKINYCDTREQELNAEEKRLYFLAVSLDSKQNHINEQYQFIKNENTRLADQRETLERAMLRIK